MSVLQLRFNVSFKIQLDVILTLTIFLVLKLHSGGLSFLHFMNDLSSSSLKYKGMYSSMVNNNYKIQ